MPKRLVVMVYARAGPHWIALADVSSVSTNARLSRRCLALMVMSWAPTPSEPAMAPSSVVSRAA